MEFQMGTMIIQIMGLILILGVALVFVLGIRALVKYIRQKN